MMPANSPMLSSFAVTYFRVISPPRLRPSETGFAEYPRAVMLVGKVSNILVTARSPYDPPALISVTEMPAALNRSNLYRPSEPGWFDSIGAHHIHCFNVAFGSALDGMMKTCNWTSQSPRY